MKERTANFYDKLRQKEWKETANYGPSTRARYNVLLNEVVKNTNLKASILDCGCGTGNFLNLLSNKGYQYLDGSDFSAEAIKIASEKFNGNLFNIDLTKKDQFPEKKYDAIICSEVLEHIQDDQIAINNLYNQLNLGGQLFISVPYMLKFWSKHDEFSGHVRRYESDELEKKIKEAGFKIKSSFGWGSFIYPFYHRFLTKSDPQKIMKSHGGFSKIKKIISKFLLAIFYFEKFFRSKPNSRRLFLIAEK